MKLKQPKTQNNIAYICDKAKTDTKQNLKQSSSLSWHQTARDFMRRQENKSILFSLIP